MQSFCVLVVLILCVQGRSLAPRVCDISSRDIYNQEIETYEHRLLCEGSQFRGSVCSSFWMRQQKLLRLKLTHEQCVLDKNQPYFDYAGTPSSPEGVFYKEQVATSSILNTTGQSQRDNIWLEHADLRQHVEDLWTDVRGDLTQLIETQWSSTRSAGSLDEQNSRAFIHDEDTHTRDDVATTAAGDRDRYREQSENTRNNYSTTEITTRENVEHIQHDTTRAHVAQQETTTRTEVDTQHDAIRALWDTETINTTTTITDAITSDSNAFKDNVESEESETRNSVRVAASAIQTQAQTEETQTRDELTSNLNNQASASQALHASDSSTTQGVIGSQLPVIDQAITTAQTTVQNAWASFVTQISFLAGLRLNDLTQNEQATFINILMHISLQSGTWDIFQPETLLNQFSFVDLFQRPEYILQLRDITNNTVSYNRAQYGPDSAASSSFSTAESYRASGRFTDAAIYYRRAYRYASLP